MTDWKYDRIMDDSTDWKKIEFMIFFSIFSFSFPVPNLLIFYIFPVGI